MCPFQQDFIYLFFLNWLGLLLQLIKADFASEECLGKNAVSVWKPLFLRKNVHMILLLGTRTSNSTQNVKFRLHIFSILSQVRFMLRFRDSCDVLSRTGTKWGLNYLGKQW